MQYIHLDCEFMPANLGPTGLISIALVCGGHAFYAVNGAMETRPILANPWMKENVWRHIPGERVLDDSDSDVMDYGAIRDGIERYLTRYAGEEFRLMTWCVCTLYGVTTSPDFRTNSFSGRMTSPESRGTILGGGSDAPVRTRAPSITPCGMPCTSRNSRTSC